MLFIGRFTGLSALRIKKSTLLTASLSPEEIFRSSNRERISTLAKNKIETMIGDINLGAWVIGGLIPVAEVAGGIALNGKLRRKVKTETDITRRKVFQKAAALSLIWPATNLAHLPATLAGFQDNMTLRRIVGRIAVPFLDTHPEWYILTLRNAIWANKLLTVADQIKEQTGRKARIAYNVGVSHATMEEFLFAGKDANRAVILAYPDVMLRALVAANGGPEYFASARLFKFPADVNTNDLSYQDRLKEVTERFVVDKKLKAALEKL